MTEVPESLSGIVEKLSKIIEKLNGAIALGAGLALLLLLLYHYGDIGGGGYFGPFFTFLHVVSGITWIGLLYYFNLVQIPTVPKIPAELKPAIGKYIAPEALFWFRWSALATVVTGLIVFSSGTAVHQFDHSHWCRARPHHGLQRVVHHLAEPEEGARPRSRRR